MATHSSILAWKIPRTELLGGLPFMGCKESATTEQLTPCFPWKSTQPIAVLLHQGFEKPREMLAPQC